MPRYRIRYRKKLFDFRCEHPRCGAVVSAALTFLQLQSEMRTEAWEIPDLEFLLHALRISFVDPRGTALFSIPSAQIYLHGKARVRFHKGSIPQEEYFLQVFTFLRRKIQLREYREAVNARRLLQQSLETSLQQCEYREILWHCFVGDSCSAFFANLTTTLQRTVAFQQQVWTPQEFSVFWDHIQQAVAVSCTEITWVDRYRGEPFRRVLPTHSLITAAELLHFLRARPPMDLAHFLTAFDACLPHPAAQWQFRCLGPESRRAALANACAVTAREPCPYPSDCEQPRGPVGQVVCPLCNRQCSDANAMLLHLRADHPTREGRAPLLARCADAWPNAVSTASLTGHMAAYRTEFEQLLQPNLFCGFCSAASPTEETFLVDFRDTADTAAFFHSWLSARRFLENWAQSFEEELPVGYVGLTYEHLQSAAVLLPAELATPGLDAAHSLIHHFFSFDISPKGHAYIHVQHIFSLRFAPPFSHWCSCPGRLAALHSI